MRVTSPPGDSPIMSSRDYPFVFSVSVVYVDTDPGRAESATVPELDKHPGLEENHSGFLQVLLYNRRTR